MSSRIEDSRPARKADLVDMARNSEMVQMRVQFEEMFLSLQKKIDQLRDEIHHSSEPTSEFVTLSEFHRIVGKPYTLRTLNNMCADGRLPAFRMGVKWMIPRSAIAKWKSEHNL